MQNCLLHLQTLVQTPVWCRHQSGADTSLLPVWKQKRLVMYYYRSTPSSDTPINMTTAVSPHLTHLPAYNDPAECHHLTYLLTYNDYSRMPSPDAPTYTDPRVCPHQTCLPTYNDPAVFPHLTHLPTFNDYISMPSPDTPTYIQ